MAEVQPMIPPSRSSRRPVKVLVKSRSSIEIHGLAFEFMRNRGFGARDSLDGLR